MFEPDNEGCPVCEASLSHKIAHFKSMKYLFCPSSSASDMLCLQLLESIPRPRDGSAGRTSSQISGSQTPNDLTRLRRQLSYILASYMQKGRRRRCVIRFVMGLSQSAWLVNVRSAETPPWRLAASQARSYCSPGSITACKGIQSLLVLPHIVITAQHPLYR